MKKKIEMVMAHLRKKKTITSMQAFQLYSATRLSAIVFSLRKKGWDISSEVVEKPSENGARVWYVKYKLVSTPAK